MPRPKKDGASEPKKRSRNGCWPCKNRKVKCGEERPNCLNCERQGEPCDYSIRLNWDGRTKRRDDTTGPEDFGDISTSGRGMFPMSLGQPEAMQDHDLHLIGQTSAAPVLFSTGPVRSQSDLTISSGGKPVLHQSGPKSPFSPLQHYTYYPSPSNSNTASPNPKVSEGLHNVLQPSLDETVKTTLLSPRRNAFDDHTVDAIPSEPPGHRHKRLRMEPEDIMGSESQPRVMPPPGIIRSVDVAQSYGTAKPPGVHLSTLSSSGTTLVDPPLTPAESSWTSDDAPFVPFGDSTGSNSLSPNLGRLSANSLMAASSADVVPNQRSSGSDGGVQQLLRSDSDGTGIGQEDESIFFGFDRGVPDTDINMNDDQNALGVVECQSQDEGIVQKRSALGQFQASESRSPAKKPTFESGKYYAQPAMVKIPKTLQPLPSILLDNPMNLLYFHHFLEHTATLLLPHDCSQNPFKVTLPQMALNDLNLLHLLLAYSASHRARLLKHEEPTNRIALWVRDVFPTLRRALDDDRKQQISDSNLATAVMLASLEIISPNTFEVPIPWQSHLDTARRMIFAKGGVQYVRQQAQVPHFLSKWFSYLDILGTLSAGQVTTPRFSASLWASDEDNREREFEIDCLMGFTTRCASILARIADLVRECDHMRFRLDGSVHPGWKPTREILLLAEEVRRDMEEARTHEYRGCSHHGSGIERENEHGWDTLEMAATNEAFHWAGLIHLYRRVLGRDTSDSLVQGAVREIVGILFKVRKGGTAEANILFPMFTAGSEAVEQGQRVMIMDRIKSVEHFGMTQVRKAGTLLQKVWDTAQPWENLVAGEFFG